MVDVNAACEFVWANGRLLERAMLAQTLRLEPPGRVAHVLRAYQTPDDGFGYGLEADVCAPESQPLFLEFALRTLHDWDLRDVDLAQGACRFLQRYAHLERGIVTLFPSALRHARAPHWDNPSALEPSLDRMVGLVGLLAWQGIAHPWLERAIEVCLARVATLETDDAHTILTCFALLEAVARVRDVSGERAHLAELLARARFITPDAPVTGYSLTPLEFSPRPDGYCRSLFTEQQYAGHLDDLASRQQPDGGWPITWQPPSEANGWAWRAHATVRAVAVLRAWGRV
jgi:hypothetical protein